MRTLDWVGGFYTELSALGASVAVLGKLLDLTAVSWDLIQPFFLYYVLASVEDFA